MAVVSIIGTGNMGSAIADVVRRGGNTVELIGHGDSEKPVTGDCANASIAAACASADP